MDWMRLEKIVKKFDLFGIQTHPIPLNPHGLRANRKALTWIKSFVWQVQGEWPRTRRGLNFPHLDLRGDY
jgi:hypothetical protein